MLHDANSVSKRNAFDERGLGVLRRAENVRIVHKPGFFSGKGYLTIVLGKKTLQVGTRRIGAEEVANNRALSATFPVRWARVGDRSYYEFQGKFYWDNDDLSAKQVHALLVTRQQAQQRQIDRAESMVAMGEGRRPGARNHIADDLKQFVWMRDEGKCRNCSATMELQFDHIIPVALGGSSEAENLQILCGPCNRRKSAGLTIRSQGAEQVSSRANTSSGVSTPLPSAGWYPDASGVGHRYWDGNAWTEHTYI